MFIISYHRPTNETAAKNDSKQACTAGKLRAPRKTQTAQTAILRRQVDYRLRPTSGLDPLGSLTVAQAPKPAKLAQLTPNASAWCLPPGGQHVSYVSAHRHIAERARTPHRHTARPARSVTHRQAAAGIAAAKQKPGRPLATAAHWVGARWLVPRRPRMAATPWPVTAKRAPEVGGGKGFGFSLSSACQRPCLSPRLPASALVSSPAPAPPLAAVPPSRHRLHLHL